MALKLKQVYKATFLLLLLLLISCSNKEPISKISSFSGTAMTIPYRVLVGTSLSPARQEAVQGLINLTFDEVNNTFNKYNPNSELSHLNNIDAYVSEPVSVELRDIFKQAGDMVLLSKGRFDPTVEPAQQLWREHLEVGCKPSEESITSIANAVGWNRVHYDKSHFWKENPETKLDLGGIAKGLCVDMLTERLVTSGFSDVLVEWGGEIRAHGSHPDNRPWTVYISRLDDTDPDHAIEYVALKNQAIATSGDYLQRWTVGGTTYTHILDPASCRPLVVSPHAIASATVIAPTCTMADALATSIMLFADVEEAKRWADDVKNRYEGVSFWIITREE